MAEADRIAAGADVTVAYFPSTQPDTIGLVDLVGDVAESFEGLVALNVPAAPTLTLTPSDARLDLAWTAPRTGGSPITGYSAQFKESSAPDSAYSALRVGALQGSISNFGPDVLTSAITGLTNGTAYTVRVWAENAAGAGPFAVGEETPAERDVTAPVLDSFFAFAIIVTEDDPDTVTIRYNEPLDTASVPAASAFTVTVGAAAGAAPTAVSIPAANPKHVVLTVAADIAAGETVTVAYTAPADNPVQDVEGNDAAGYAASDAAVANRAAAPTVTLTVADGRLIAMVAAPAADGGSAVIFYEIQHKQSSAADTAYATSTINAFIGADGAATATIAGLTNGTSYDVRAHAVNDAFGGPWSEPVSETPDTTVAAPASVWAFPGDDLVLVRWTPPEGITDDANLLGYEIQYKSGTQTYSTTDRRAQPAKADSDGNLVYEHHVESLTNDTEYTFRIRLRAAAGTGLWSDEATATPVDSSEPSDLIVANRASVVRPAQQGVRQSGDPKSAGRVQVCSMSASPTLTAIVDYRTRVQYVTRLNDRTGDTVPVTGVRVRLVYLGSGCTDASVSGFHPDHPNVIAGTHQASIMSDFNAVERPRVVARDRRGLRDPDVFGDDAYPSAELLELGGMGAAMHRIERSAW